MISVHVVLVPGGGPCGDGACWAIRTSQLSALLRVYIWPIDVMVYHGPPGIAPWETWF